MNVVRTACNGVGSLVALALCSVTGAISLFLALFGVPACFVLGGISLTGNAVLIAKFGGRLQAWTTHQAITAALILGAASTGGLLLLFRG